MLDSKASEIDQLERPEVFSALGSVEGKKVLELGAGIGRFTGGLARMAHSVVAVDFMEPSIRENERINAHLGNVKFQVGDVTELQFEPGSFDVVFSNWLLMYLSDSEVEKLAAVTLSWLRPGGVVFFRESCFRQSGDKTRKSNPTHYRNPREYFRVFDSTEHINSAGRCEHFELISCKCIDTYVRLKKNQNQVCWKWRKIEVACPRIEQARHFLDGAQYTTRSIQKYEHVFGSGFLSTGGGDFALRLTSILNLQPSSKLLDIGCGVGGADFLISEAHGVHVHGLDLSVNAFLLALEHAATRSNDDVSFEVADCLTKDFGTAAFDAIYSRDSLVHVSKKAHMFKRLYKFLKPGGRLLITDYCRSDTAPPSPGFASYISQRGYDVRTMEEYSSLLQQAGLSGVRAEDRSDEFRAAVKAELERLTSSRTEFESKFSAEEYTSMLDGWAAKLQRLESGEQRWGVFVASKGGVQ